MSYVDVCVSITHRHTYIYSHILHGLSPIVIHIYLNPALFICLPFYQVAKNSSNAVLIEQSIECLDYFLRLGPRNEIPGSEYMNLF